MKILISNPGMTIGGIASSLSNWLYFLKNETNHEVDIVVFDDEFDEKYEHLKHEFNFIILNQFKSLRLDHKKLKNYKFSWTLKFIFLFMLRKTGLMPFYLKRVFKNYTYPKKYDLAISYANDIVRRQDYVLSNDFVEFSVDAKQKATWIHSDIKNIGITEKYVKRRFKNFNYIVCVSEANKQQLDESFPELQPKTIVISNPIGAEMLKKQAKEQIDYEFDTDTIHFITVARLSREKRIDRIIETADLLRANNLNFKWLILGGGAELSSFKEKIKANGLGNHIHFLGFISNPYPYVKRADYFVLTSDYEAQPISVLESLILGTPVVTTNIPIMSEIIETGRNGYIVDKNAQSIADKLTEIINEEIQLKGFEFHYDKFRKEFHKFEELISTQIEIDRKN